MKGVSLGTLETTEWVGCCFLVLRSGGEMERNDSGKRHLRNERERMGTTRLELCNGLQCNF